MDVAYLTCGVEVPPGAEETLACFNCDCDSPNSIVEATRSGWTDIEFWDGHNAYFIGVCPLCRDAAAELKAAFDETQRLHLAQRKGKTMTGAEMIADERDRQIESEGWSQEHDDLHSRGEMAIAAEAYLCGRPEIWPWHSNDWKPGDRVRDLVKAGALIAAEIDRLNRAGQDAC